MKITWTFLLLLLSISTIVSRYPKEKTLKRLKRHHHQENEIELRRTKRTLYQALLKKKYKEKRSIDDWGVDINERSLVKKPTNAKRPYQKEQVQDVRASIEVIHEWRNEMLNKTSPEYELLAGNIIDAIDNEFNADMNFLLAGVTKLTKTKSKRKIIADITLRFYKTEDDPVSHLQGIISKGWISGQQIDPNYFKLLGVTNGNNEKLEWHYPEEVELRVIPAMITPEETKKETKKIKEEKPTSYKEVRVLIKLKQRFEMFLDDHNSPEFSELSGNVEQAVTKVFALDKLFVGVHVIEFRESDEGRVFVHCAIQFNKAEKYAIEKCQAMISSGDLAGMPVDEQYFVVSGVSQSEEQNGQSNQQRYQPTLQPINNQPNTQQTPIDIPQPQPMERKYKPKPLKFKEVRVSIKFREPWNQSFSSNLTTTYAIFSGMVEQAVDRGQTYNPYYIDATLVDFLQSNDSETIANIAVRFHIEEEDPEGRLRSLITNGTLSGLPVDQSFFYVFTVSETHNPHIETTQQEQASNALSAQQGQKQPAENIQNNLKEAMDVKPTTPVLSSTAKPTTSGLISTTFNPYLPTEKIKQPKPSQQTTVNPYSPVENQDQHPKEVSQHPTMQMQSVSTNENQQYTNQNQQFPPNTNMDTTGKQGNYPGYSYSNGEQAQQSYPAQSYTQQQVNPITYNPYLPDTKETDKELTASITAPAPSVAPNNNGKYNDSKKELSNDIEGSMTLEQSWHPYLADKSSQVYNILEQNVVTAIKNIYAQDNDEVIPTILGFSETDIPVTSVSETNEKKVSVRFRISFLQGHNATSKPLEDAVTNHDVAGVLIYQNSLVIADSTRNPTPEGSPVNDKQLSLCQKEQKFAESETEGGPIGGFTPQCKDDGSYKSVQCHALTGFCWCVTKAGVRIMGTEERYKKPNCEGIKLSGTVRLPEHAPETLLPKSCLTIFVQEMISCGNNVDCHIPVIANKTFKDITIKNQMIPYALMTTKLKPGQYIVNAVVNVGWCRINSLKSSEQIHPGDYHSTDMHDIIVEAGMKSIERNINVEFMKEEESGIKLHGNIVFPQDTQFTSIPEGSCLSIQTKQLRLCKGPNCPTTPTSGNATVTDLELIDNTIPYSIQLPELEPGTYVISVVLHAGNCPHSSQSMMAGDYYNDEMYDYTVASETTDVEKDVSVVKLMGESDGGISVTGRVLFPTQITLPPGSCLSISSRKLIQCKNNNCKIPPVGTKTIENITNDGGIPYNLILPVATPGTYIISAVVNMGWCKAEDGKEWIRPGDYFNEKIHDFEVKNTSTAIGKNINVAPFDAEEKSTGVTVHGRVILSTKNNLEFPSNSCLTIKAQEFKLCGGTINCVNPIFAKETYHTPQLENNVIPYAVVLPNVASGHYIISAVLNVGWCKETDTKSEDWIRSGDFHNEEANDFIISEGMNEIEKDIEIEQYVDTVTGPPNNIEPETEQPKPQTNPEGAQTTVPVGSYNQVEVATTTVPYTTNAAYVQEVQASNSVGTQQINMKNESAPMTNQVVITTRTPTLSPYSSDTTKAPVSYESISEKNALTNSLPTTQQQPKANEATTGALPVQNTNSTEENQINSTETTISSTSPPPEEAQNNQSEEIITLPSGLPKSCQEIRDAGIGSMDGQYIIEARPRCHISIICQSMDQTNPKEFLGGPSEDEWKYWHYAVLIKISDQDKQNIPSGACLEHSEQGRNLLKRILAAGASQGNPISQWKTNISQLLRSKRDLPQGNSLITKARTIYKGKKQSDIMHQSEWGVL